MSVKNDVKTIVSQSVSLPLSATATCVSMAADGLGVVEKGVKHTPSVVKALLSVPFAAAKGYIMESDGVTAEVAEARAYKYLKQDLSATIEEVGVGSGKLLADLLKDDDADVTDGSITTSEKKEVNDQ